MKKLLTTLAALTVMTSSAFAQSFDPDNGTGNVLSLNGKLAASQNYNSAVHQGGIRAYGMVPRTHTAVTSRKEDAAYSRNWSFVPGGCAEPEVNDPVGLVSPEGERLCNGKMRKY